MAIEKIGVIGLGKMGGPLARHLRGAGFAVMGYDVAKAAVDAVADAGVKAATDCAEIGAACDLAIIGVGFDSQVEETLFGESGLMTNPRDELIVAIASTASPQMMKDIAARSAGMGVTFLDIPMCRGEHAAIAGELLIMGGGDKGTFDECRPAFETFASSIYYLGDLGAGQVGKMVNNLILWACISANTEGTRIASALGVEAGPLREALLDSSAHNWAMEVQADQWPMPWAEKDMTIVLKEADAARVSLPLCGSIKEVIKGVKIDRGEDMPREH